MRAAVVAAEAEELLVPAAGRLDVAHRDQGLRLGGANRDDDADPVAGGVVDLGQPALAAVELRPALHRAAVGDDRAASVGASSSAQIHTTGPRRRPAPGRSSTGRSSRVLRSSRGRDRPTIRRPPRRTRPSGRCPAPGAGGTRSGRGAGAVPTGDGHCGSCRAPRRWSGGRRYRSVDSSRRDGAGEPAFVLLDRPAALSGEPIEHGRVHEHPQRVDGLLAAA